MPYDAPPDLGQLSLTQIAELAAARRLPPVESWNPDRTGESEMRIAADGRWFHQDGEITRPAMIRAFSALLRREADGEYWLVTPQEKLRIDVEDVPFIAVEMQVEGEGQYARIGIRLNTDDLIIAGPDHSIEMRRYDDSQVPYIHVRHGLWARASRSLSYQLLDLALSCKTTPPGLWSNGVFFPLGSAE
ncbi:MAG: DUF1285 domain-containing protein [Sphingorhabdus sp.]